jgi:riboflavin synthase
MFTGIIEALGSVSDLQLRNAEWRIRISSKVLDLSDVKIGDSIAVNGVCLTVVQMVAQDFSADVSAETMKLTTLHNFSKGTVLNLEKALKAGGRLGGHIVSGHVDGVGELLSIKPDGGSIQMSFRAPVELARYIAKKGSICIDGTSLTVNEVNGACFSVYIIPHTQAQTVMHTYQKGERVNLEVDLISRYLERLILGDKAADMESDTHINTSSALTQEYLLHNGFGHTK